MAENNPEKEQSISDASKKSWLEQQIEKIVGGQKEMQPIIKTCLSVVGFIGGFVAGYFIFGKEKDKKLHEQELLMMELKQTGREQEKEIKFLEKQLEEIKTKSLETENKLLKEGKKEEMGELNGLITLRSSERSYLD
jgi:NifB/MoaA-like Fe-S oxidoreductase